MDGTGHITGKHFPKELAEYLCIHGSQNVQDLIVGKYLSQIKRNTLIQKAQSISHGSVAFFCHIAHSFILRFHSFCSQKLRKPGSYGINGDPVEIVTLASGQDRDRYLMGLRGRQDKNNIGRRLFQCFQKSVECSC